MGCLKTENGEPTKFESTDVSSTDLDAVTLEAVEDDGGTAAVEQLESFGLDTLQDLAVVTFPPFGIGENECSLAMIQTNLTLSGISF